MNISSQYIKILAVVLTYWTISISLVFSNKYLVGTKTSEHNVALFTAWVQCVITVIVTVIVNYTKSALMKDKTETSLKLDYRRLFSPYLVILTVSYVGMLSFNNLCLRYVNVSFYQVARSLTLIFVVIFSLTILKKSVSWRIWLCCISVAGGFILGIDQENILGALSLSGVLFGVVTSLFVSLNGIFTKKALDVVERDAVQLTLLNNINASVLFLPVILATGQLQTALTVVDFHTPFFCIFLLGTGVLAFAIAWISAVQINLTSPVTHHISANLKAVLQTIIAVIYNQETKTFLWWISIAMIIGGALSYALIRIKEERTEKQKIANEKTTKDLTIVIENDKKIIAKE